MIDDDVKRAIELYLALAPDEAVAMILGGAALQIAIRRGDESTTAADAIRELLAGGAFDSDEAWAVTRQRTIRNTDNYRRLYGAAAIVAQAKRPQG